MMRISNLFSLVSVLLFTSFSNAEYSYQRNWFGGPGVPGPTTWWGATFASSENMSYAALQMYLFLGISSTQHVISTSVTGCYYAFPADFDGDGDLDVVASQTSTLTPYMVAWFENNGTGGGWDMHIISENYAMFHCVYPADIDLDGDMDIVGGNKAMGKKGLEWFRNDDGIGDSWTRFRIAYWGSPMFVCCSDMDGDDTLEVIAPSWGDPNEIAWWESTTWPPDTSWQSHQVSGGIAHGRELFTIDLDQDGDMDVVSADEDQDGLKWYENTDGMGLSWSEHDVAGYFDLPYSAHASDIDGDGDIDIVYCSEDEQKAAWCENLNGIGTSWEEHVIDEPLYNARGIHSAYITSDDHADVIVVLSTGSSGRKLYFYRNMNGSGLEWARYQLASGSWFEDVDVADFDLDGTDDILAAAPAGTYVSWHELEGNTDGWLLSSILDVTSYPQWDSVTWVAEEPLGTDIFFQVRASNDWEDMGAWCDTLFEPQSLTGVIDSTFRYIQYRVGMTSDTEYLTPILEEVRFYWTFLGIEGGEGYEEFEVTACPNPASSSVNIAIPAPFIGSTEIFIYDISGKLIRSFSGLETNCMQWDCRDNSGNEIPSGLYLVQAISEEKSRTMRLTIL